MGPFPHDQAPSVISEDNPMGTDGFAFVEFTHPDPAALDGLFRQMGFLPVARHRRHETLLYRQGDIHYLVSSTPDSHAARFAAAHGPSVPSMGFYVVDAAHAFARAIALGAEPAGPEDGAKTLDVPAIRGIGGSLLYFIDQYGAKGSPFAAEFDWLPEASVENTAVGLTFIDHLTHNVQRGRMDYWYDFYRRLFNFRQIRFFDIEGKMTGLFSRAITSPCGRIRIPLNESADDKSQIEEYLRLYQGEGIQHIAMGAANIYPAVEALRARGLAFMPAPPATYFDRVDTRLPGHGENLARLRRNGILIDGEGVVETKRARLLLQIFSANVIGPVFFEFIERKGDDGFGEGNFRALFESIEEDQIRRGVLKPEPA